MGDLTGWVLAEKWHRASLGAAETYCGQAAVGDRVDVETVLDDTRLNRTSICGTCDRIAAALRGEPTVNTPSPDRLARLTPEQLEIVGRRQQEQVKRVRVRLAAEQDKTGATDPSRSVRAVSGGLPGLGRKSKK